MTTETYLKSDFKIGLMTSFPVKEVINSYTCETLCRNIPVKFQVHVCLFSFGEQNEYECPGIITDRVDISHKLFLHGFGQGVDHEVLTMREGITKIAEQEGLTICDVINDWPYAKVTVTSLNNRTILTWKT